ncbi:hypothetical protein Tco_1311372 [Tanacetum coccineum]
MMKPCGSHMNIFFISFMLLLVCNQCRKIDYNEIKGTISSRICDGYCERIHPDALWSCCRKSDIIENYKADCHVDHDRLNEARRSMFRTTCSGPWLDITYVENDDGMIHYVLQKLCCADDHSFDFPLIYYVNGHSLHFLRCQFCLLTGFKFGLLSFCEYRNGDIPFRNRLFPEKIGYDVAIINILALIEDEEKFSQVSDEDAIQLYLLLSLEVIFIRRELVSVVDDVFLRMVDNLDA